MTPTRLDEIRKRHKKLEQLAYRYHSIAHTDRAELLAYVEKLERVAKAAHERLTVWTRETYIELEKALAALDAEGERDV